VDNLPFRKPHYSAGDTVREKFMWSEWGLLNLKALNNPQCQPLAELKFSVALQHEVIGVGILAVYGMKVKSRP